MTSLVEQFDEKLDLKGINGTDFIIRFQVIEIICRYHRKLPNNLLNSLSDLLAKERS